MIPFSLQTFTITFVSIMSGIILTKTGHFCVVAWIGWLAATLRGDITCLLGVKTTILRCVYPTLPVGVGFGLLFASVTLVNQAASNDTDMAFAVR